MQSNSKIKSDPNRGDAKPVSRARPTKDENRKPYINDSKKRSNFRRDGGTGARPRRGNAGDGPSVQQKNQVPPATGWFKGGSSPSFADVVRKKPDAANPDPQERPGAAGVVLVETPKLDVTPSVHPVDVEPLVNEAEEIVYAISHHDDVLTQSHTVPAPLEDDESDVTPPIRYYVLEIDRIGEEVIVLPPHIVQIATENHNTFTFSGQSGKPPTPPTAQIPSQFYRPETAPTRQFVGVGGNADITRGAPWGARPGQSPDYTNWPLQERHQQRGFAQGIQYSSYGAPAQQQTQRVFAPMATNRMRQHDMVPDASLRPLRDNGASTAFNRHPGSSGGMW